MTTQLPERLRDLAEEAPEVLSATGLWQAGRRRHLRQVATAAVVGCLVAATAALGVGDWRSRQPDPAAPRPTGTGPMSLPDRFFPPSPWLPSTRTPGRLVAVLHATRDHFPWGSTNDEIVGVAAGSQRYTFLDLPGRSTVDLDVALAPDGRHLAYWVSGPTRKPTTGEGPPVTGIAIDDLTTGQVETHQIASDYGIGGEVLQWTDGSTVVVSSSRNLVANGGMRGHYFARAYRVGSTQVVRLSDARALGAGDALQARGVFATMAGQRELRVYDPSTGHILARATMSRQLIDAAYDPPTKRVAGVAAGRQRGLLVAQVLHGSAVLRRPPVSLREQGVLGWADRGHVVARVYAGRAFHLSVVDVETGAAHRLARTPDTIVQVAADAIRDPVTSHAIEPPRPWNPRPIAAWSLVALALLAWGMFVVGRSRVRR